MSDDILLTGPLELKLKESDYFDFLFDYKDGNGEVWKLYGVRRLNSPAILDQETFVPYRPFTPIYIEERIGIKGETIKKFPTIIPKGQTFKGYNLEDPNQVREITT